MIFLALGSSIGPAEHTFARVERKLKENDISVVKKSKNLKNPPYGGVAQNEFTNAVWQLETTHPPLKLLGILQGIEHDIGRVRKEKWEDRVIDLDLLMYDNQIIRSATLTLPHPEIVKRIFVLQPWSELVDEAFEIPTFGKLTKLLSALQ